MLWPFSGRAGKTDLTCGCGCACTENNGGADVYDLAKSDDLFSSIINNVESDITVMDFKSASQAFSFIAQTGFKTETVAYFKSTVG